MPEEKIRIRYHRALAMIPKLIDVCDKILIYDNSDRPSLIYSKTNSAAEMFPNRNWSELELRELLGL